MAEQSSCPACGRADITTRTGPTGPVLRVHQRPTGGWCEGSRRPAGTWGPISLDRARTIGRAVEHLRVGGAIAVAYAGPESVDRIELGTRPFLRTSDVREVRRLADIARADRKLRRELEAIADPRLRAECLEAF